MTVETLIEVTYTSTVGSRFSDKDAQVLGPELEKLAESGASTATDIVAAAQSKISPLHKYFEWNDKAAGQKWREEQARSMARSIMVTRHDTQPVRAFYAIRVTYEDGTQADTRSYQTIRMVSQDEDKCGQVVAETKRALVACYHKYNLYRSVFPAYEEKFGVVFDAIGAAVEAIEMEQELVESVA